MITIINLTNTAKYSLRPSSSKSGAWTIDFTKNGKKFSTRFDNLGLAYSALLNKANPSHSGFLSQQVTIRNSSQKGHYTVMYFNFQSQQYAQMRCDSLPAAKNFAQNYAREINALISSTQQKQQQAGLSIFEQSYGMSQQTASTLLKWQDEASFKEDIHEFLTIQNHSTSQRLR